MQDKYQNQLYSLSGSHPEKKKIIVYILVERMHWRSHASGFIKAACPEISDFGMTQTSR